MVKRGHEIVRGGDNFSIHDDKVWSDKGVTADVGVLADGWQ